MRSHENIARITGYLERLVTKVQINNGVGLTDINSAAEDFFCSLLNIIFDTKLKNLNLKKLNFPAIDLGDENERLCFQVTSTKSKPKIQKTINRFCEHELFKIYDDLKIILVSSSSYCPSGDFEINCALKFDKTKDILCIPDILKLIQGLSPSKQNSIIALLESEFDSISNTKVSNEVETLIELIDYLSSNKKIGLKKFTEIPDPEGKIQHRFSEHSKFLNDEIVRLIPLYAEAKETVWEIKGYNLIDIEHIKIYLQNESSRILNECDNNPRAALDKFINQLKVALSKSGKKYDETAIRYFVIDELIHCNVFPN